MIGLYILHLLRLIVTNIIYRLISYAIDKSKILDPTSVIS